MVSIHMVSNLKTAADFGLFVLFIYDSSEEFMGKLRLGQFAK
jgi:hypothetical protein